MAVSLAQASKTALITGASGGIGQAIAQQLLADGYDLALVARNVNKLNDMRRGLGAIFPDAAMSVHCCDVSQYEQVASLFAQFQAQELHIHALINAAGISGGGITAQISNEVWEDVINTNLNGTFYVTKELLRHELMPTGGRIVNIASTGGKQGVLHGAPYSASKHGMIGLTKALGLELARNGSGITVNAICPGFVETEMAERVRQNYAKIWNTDAEETKRRVVERIPIGRYVKPSEVAAMVAYVVSPAAASVTAQALNVCGGLGNY